MSITQFSGTIYPDKTFSLGIVPRKKKRASEREYDRAYRANQPLYHSKHLEDWITGVNSVEGKFCSLSEAPLFIESPKSSRDSRGKYGKHGITGFGKKFVRNSALLLERKYTKKRLGFVTCTLPSYPAVLQERINGIWGEILRRFYQKVKRQLEKLSEPFIYVGVTEIQEKRYRRTGIPVPHLHFVYLCRGVVDNRYWLYICQLHRAWNEAVAEGIRLCGYPFPDDFRTGTGSVHAKRVKRSTAAYLGKYMSKGGKVLEDMANAGWTEFPSQWWNADMSTKKLYVSALIKPSQTELKALFYGCEHYLQEGLLTWMSFVDIEIEGVYCRMGLVGTMSRQMYDCFNTE